MIDRYFLALDVDTVSTPVFVSASPAFRFALHIGNSVSLNGNHPRWEIVELALSRRCASTTSIESILRPPGSARTRGFAVDTAGRGNHFRRRRNLVTAAPSTPRELRPRMDGIELLKGLRANLPGA